MKKLRYFLPAILSVALLCSSFTPAANHSRAAAHSKMIPMYYWFSPSNVFLDFNTVFAEEAAFGFDTNPVNGTLEMNGYTAITADGKPAGTLTFKLYSHQ